MEVLSVFDEDAGEGGDPDALLASMAKPADATVAAQLRQRRAALAGLYRALPPYVSAAFWQALADPALPLEVLVRVLRETLSRHDTGARQRISTQIIQRVQDLNHLWARKALRLFSISEDEGRALAGDLCADLHECLLRALYDPARRFWEENFLHALYFERKHVLRAFVIREGFWTSSTTLHGTRVPRSLIASLDAQPRDPHDPQVSIWELEDPSAQKFFQLIEHHDLFLAVLQLPEKFKAIVLLVFWEGRTEKEVACILAISDRTVRNRLRAALRLLRALLSTEREDPSHV